MEKRTSTTISLTATKIEGREPEVLAKIEVDLNDADCFPEIFMRDVPEMAEKIDRMLSQKRDMVAKEFQTKPSEEGIQDEKIQDVNAIRGKDYQSNYGPAVYALLGYCLHDRYLEVNNNAMVPSGVPPIRYSPYPAGLDELASSIYLVMSHFNRYTRVKFIQFLMDFSADNDDRMKELIDKLNAAAKGDIYEH